MDTKIQNSIEELSKLSAEDLAKVSFSVPWQYGTGASIVTGKQVS